MAYELECDETLKFFCSQLENADYKDEMNFTPEQLHEKLLKANVLTLNFKQFNVVVNILHADNYIQFLDDKWGLPTGKFTMSQNGIIFINTKSYVEQKKGWELERKLNEQNVKMSALELKLKRGTFYIAAIAAILSILNFLGCNNNIIHLLHIQK